MESLGARGAGARPALLAYAAALRHLGARQAWRNLVQRAWRRGRSRPRLGPRLHHDLEFAGRAAAPFAPSPGHARLEAGAFTAVGHTGRVGEPPDWNGDGPLLWLFNLHYFDYLDRVPLGARVPLVLDWIDRHSPEWPGVGWMPYPLSLRLRNWTRLFFQALEWPADARSRVLHSVELQGNCLAANVEWHLRGNHLLENGLTLTLLAACFRGHATDGWRRLGRAILARELDEQFLPDGGHFERSPMYHALLTGALLDLVTVLEPGDGLRDQIRGRLPSLIAFLAALRHPDTNIALFNDSALDIAPEPQDLLRNALALGFEAPSSGPAAFPDTGYWIWRDSSDALLVDAGPVGPDYLPAHAHGDIFSFELSLAGRRVVVDGGVSTYEAGAERAWARSTRAHNTVEVGGQDQCEFFGSFRMGRRGRPREVSASVTPAELRLQGWHDAYRRLPGRPVHRRELRFRPPGVLLVWDRVDSGRPHPVVARVRLAPGLSARRTTAREARIELPGRELVFHAFGGELGSESGLYSPRFGAREPCEVLTLTAGPNTDFGFALAPGDRPAVIDAAGAEVDGVRLARGSPA